MRDGRPDADCGRGMRVAGVEGRPEFKAGLAAHPPSWGFSPLDCWFRIPRCTHTSPLIPPPNSSSAVRIGLNSRSPHRVELPQPASGRVSPLASSQASHRAPSERQVVVLCVKRPGKLLEVSAALLGLFGRTGARRGRVERVAGAALSTDQEDLTNVDLGDVARLLLLVLILPVLDATLDVELVALLHVALDDVEGRIEYRQYEDKEKQTRY